jgi:hypothetical protein
MTEGSKEIMKELNEKGRRAGKKKRMLTCVTARAMHGIASLR